MNQTMSIKYLLSILVMGIITIYALNSFDTHILGKSIEHDPFYQVD